MQNTDINNEAMEHSESGGVDLYEAYSQGKSLEELNEMLASQDAEESEAELSGEDTDMGGGLQDEVEPENGGGEAIAGRDEPYRVYKTKESFQQDFDYAFNKRYAEMKTEQKRQADKLGRMNQIMSKMLGVSEDDVLSELERRQFMMEAEEKGSDNPEQYAMMRSAQEEAARLRQQMARQSAQDNANRMIADIRRQGEELTKAVPGFNLDKAMENEGFRQTVFSLQQAGNTQAVASAYKAIFFEDYMKSVQAGKETAQTVNHGKRIKEGGAVGRTGGTVKPADVAGMSSQEILALEKRILRGEKVSFN